MAGSKFLLTLKFTKQGTIKGSSKKNEGGLDFSKGMECHGFSFEVEAQFDSSSGNPSGKRQHQPIKIVREIDAASPLLWQALCSNEIFQTASLSFGKTGPYGKPPRFRTIELRDGVISQIKPAPSSGGKKRESITLTFEELIVNGTPRAAMLHYS